MANTGTSLSLCSDQVINLWKEFGVKDDQVMRLHEGNGATTRRELFGQDEAGDYDGGNFVGTQILVHTRALLRVVATSMVDLVSTRPQFWGVMPSKYLSMRF